MKTVGSNASLSTQQFFSGCLNLIAIINSEVVYNRTIELDINVGARCEPGTKSSTGTNVPIPCDVCPVGTYSTVGLSSCIDCPADVPFTLAIGSVALTDCIKCPLGQYCPVGSDPLPCPMSGFYEGPGDDVLDRRPEDCVKTKRCDNGFWCGAGAALGSSYVRELAIAPLSTTTVIRQRKSVLLTLENLRNDDNIIVRMNTATPNWFLFSPLQIDQSMAASAPVVIESALLGDADKVNSNVTLEWFLSNSPDNVFTYSFPVTITIVGIIVTPLSFQTSIAAGSDVLIPPIPTEVQVYNTLCNNSVRVTVLSNDCHGVPLPDWFNLTGTDPFNPRPIDPQNGLPLTIAFKLVNSPSLTAAREDDFQLNRPTPFLSLCVNLDLELVGLGINVPETLNISFRLLKPVRLSLQAF
jgi:hypothetical protein